MRKSNNSAGRVRLVGSKAKRKVSAATIMGGARGVALSPVESLGRGQARQEPFSPSDSPASYTSKCSTIADRRWENSDQELSAAGNLNPGLKSWVDNCIVPILVEEFLADLDREK